MSMTYSHHAGKWIDDEDVLMDLPELPEKDCGMTNSRRIGADAEREAAGRINRLFGTRFRRSQQHAGAIDAPDLIDDDHPELAPESKRNNGYSIALHRGVEKARSESDKDATAFVVHRMSGQRWLLTVDLLEAPELVSKLAAILFEKLPANLILAALDDLDTVSIAASGCAAAIFEAMLKDARAVQKIAEAEGINGKRRQCR